MVGRREFLAAAATIGLTGCLSGDRYQDQANSVTPAPVQTQAQTPTRTQTPTDTPTPTETETPEPTATETETPEQCRKDPDAYPSFSATIDTHAVISDRRELPIQVNITNNGKDPGCFTGDLHVDTRDPIPLRTEVPVKETVTLTKTITGLRQGQRSVSVGEYSPTYRVVVVPEPDPIGTTHRFENGLEATVKEIVTTDTVDAMWRGESVTVSSPEDMQFAFVRVRESNEGDRPLDLGQLLNYFVYGREHGRYSPPMGGLETKNRYRVIGRDDIPDYPTIEFKEGKPGESVEGWVPLNIRADESPEDLVVRLFESHYFDDTYWAPE